MSVLIVHCMSVADILAGRVPNALFSEDMDAPTTQKDVIQTAEHGRSYVNIRLNEA